MTRRLLAVCLIAAWTLSAQEAAPVFRAGVSLVRIDVDISGQPRNAQSLTAGDFVVHDNGQPQAVRHIAREEVPLDLILLFDISGSMKPGVSRVAAGARAALSELRPGDRVALFAFSTGLLLLQDFTSDLSLIQRAVEEQLLQLSFTGGTPLRHSIHQAALSFPAWESEARRRAMLVITDNRGQASGAPVELIVDALWRLDLVVSGLILQIPGGPSSVFPIGVTRGARSAIHQAKYGASMDPLVQATGGELVTTGKPDKDFRNLIHRLRHRYSLYYPPPNAEPGQRRALSVELTSEARRRLGRARILARTGYRIPADRN